MTQITTAEALGIYFPLVLNGETVKVKGLHMPDIQLEKYGKLDKHPVVVPAALADLAPVARQLLAETVATSDQDESGKPRTVRVPAPPPEEVPEDDGMGPSGVWERQPDPHPGEVTSPTSHPPVAVKAAVPHATKPTQEDMPSWVRELFAEVRRANENAALAADSAIVIMDKMTSIATTLKSWASESKPTAPGIGQGGGAGQASSAAQFLYATRAVIEHKNGKVYINFWDDDNENLKYSVIYGAKTAEAWRKLIPWVNPAYFNQLSDKDWFKSFPELDKVGQFPLRCNIYYTLSSKLNKEGNPFKDIQRIEKL